jgi:hypothetical protein
MPARYGIGALPAARQPFPTIPPRSRVVENEARAQALGNAFTWTSTSCSACTSGRHRAVNYSPDGADSLVRPYCSTRGPVPRAAEEEVGRLPTVSRAPGTTRRQSPTEIGPASSSRRRPGRRSNRGTCCGASSRSPSAAPRPDRSHGRRLPRGVTDTAPCRAIDVRVARGREDVVLTGPAPTRHPAIQAQPERRCVSHSWKAPMWCSEGTSTPPLA